MSTTHHDVHVGDSRLMTEVPSSSVHLVVTSPPYPMIEMWDEGFSALDPAIAANLEAGDGSAAFAAMHAVLDGVWRECHRVLVPGGIVCINVGDATRTIDGTFRLWPNHARVIAALSALGFVNLPDILWRKPSNAPNKFMGSGMLPAGAYATYEHEYVLIARKERPRAFETPEEKAARRASAFFWEERNRWFSDLWTDVLGDRQEMTDPLTRRRSAAFPFELAYRLILMYSLAGDRVLDPFMGTGTTAAAAFATGRSSLGYELDATLVPEFERVLHRAVTIGRQRAQARLRDHLDFVAERREMGREPSHVNAVYGFPVVTRQEQELEILEPVDLDPLSACRYRGRHRRALLASPIETVQLDLFGE